MSDFDRPSDKGSSTARALDALVVEAKTHLDVCAPESPAASKKDALADLDWSRLEARVMASIEREKPALLHEVQRAKTRSWSRDETLVSGRRGSAEGGTRDGALRVGAFVLAAAAAVALFVRKDREGVVGEPVPTASEGASASSLRATEPLAGRSPGEVRIAGVVATPGYVLHGSDSIEADGARAVFERPRKVTWLLEQDGPTPDSAPSAPNAVAHARVKSAGEPLILALENGAIEAQVVPVPQGEAFAVDIATERSLVRVAVHGTHLRVARAGNRVAVDLTEGVVSIGVPPRVGVTYGTIVTAPAHVELDATDLATLRIDHTPASVRAAIPLGPHEPAVVGAVRVEPSPAPVPPPVPATPAVASKGGSAHPVENSAPAKIDSPKVLVPPRDAIANAVRDCAAARSRSGEVRVTVSSNLRLRVSPGGTIESAQFSPPLLPDIQSCAAQVIYKLQLDETGLVTIPIEFSY
jgi:hypothetical protein